MNEPTQQQQETVAEKKYELRVIFSVINNTRILDITPVEKQELIEFLLDHQIDPSRMIDYSQYVGRYLIEMVKNGPQISQLLDVTKLDKQRYNKLCDAQWMRHNLQRGSIPKTHSIE